jgi:hypothetical protein
MGVAVFGARELMVAGDVPTLARLVIAILVGAAVYVPAAFWRASETTDEIMAVVNRRRRKPAPAVGPALAET